MPEQLSLFEPAEPEDWAEYRGQLKPLGCRSKARRNEAVLYQRLMGAFWGFVLGFALGKPLEGLSPRGVRKRLGRKRPQFEIGVLEGSQPLLAWPWLVLETALENAGRLEVTSLAEKARRELPETFPWEVRQRLSQGLLPPATGVGSEAAGENYFGLALAPWAGLLHPGRPMEAAEAGFETTALVASGAGRQLGACLAAACSATACEHHYRWLFEIGLSHVPRHTRLARTLYLAMRLHDSTYSQGQALEAVARTFKLPPDYKGKPKPPFEGQEARSALPNAAVVALAWLYGEGDFTATLEYAVRGGWQASLNAGACGAVLGAAKGIAELPAEALETLPEALEIGLASRPLLTFAATEELCKQLAHLLAKA